MVNSNRMSGSAGEEFSSMKSSSSDRDEQQLSEGATKVQSFASDVSQKASEIGSEIGRKAERGMHTLGEKIDHLSSAIREHTPSSLGSAATSINEGLQAGKRYLSDHGISDLQNELSGAVKRHPMTSLCVGVGIGFLIGQALVRR